MQTHNTYTIAGWTTTDGRRLGWKLRRVRNVSEVRYDGGPSFHHDPTGIELADDSILPTNHGSLDYYAVFEGVEPDMVEYNYRIVIGYYTGCPYLWAVELRRDREGMWALVEENSHYVSADWELEQILGPRTFELDDSTIARRILEFMHERF